jgi:branched-chain amino acid transport system permease protein
MLIVQQLLNGLSFGALLFLVASGFTLVFGLMRIANLAHGAFYLLGGYLGVVVTAKTNLAVGLITAALIVAVLALVVERVLLKRVHGNELAEVLLTIGVAFVVADLCLAIFGGNPMSLGISDWLKGRVQFGDIPYPKYRLFIIVFTIVIAVALHLFQKRSRVGAMIRAGVDHREMAGSCGINVRRLVAGVFVVGAALAGVAGVVGAGLLSLRPGSDIDILLFALVVVVIGGLGSIKGAAVGSVLIGLVDAISRVWLPELSYFTIFMPMALVLIFRPTGLFGRSVAR